MIGHFNSDLRNFQAVVSSPGVAWLARVVYYVLPDFSSFDIKSQVVWGERVPAVYVILTVGYGLAYIVFVLAASVAVFQRRDFK